MKNCFGYIRVSTQKQGEGVSLEAQRDAIQAFADRNGMSICRWFAEKETAAKQGRPIFTQMVRELRQGRAAGVVMHKVDRSARNARDWVVVGDLSDAGIDVYFATDSLDFRTRGGRLTADIQAVIAADYIRNLREETIKGLTGRLKQGLYPFKAPIGYLDNGRGKPKTIDPVRGPMVRRAFELYGGGQYSLRSLLGELNSLGIRNVSDRPLSKRGLETVLCNPFYCGLIVIRRSGETYVGIHEPLISAALYQRVQDVKAGRAGKKVTKHRQLYRGLFRCRLCHGPMTPEHQKRHVYYRCQRPNCPTKCIREENMTDALAAFLVRMSFSDVETKILMVEMERWWRDQQLADKAKSLRLQLAQLDQRLERLTDAVIDGTIDRNAYLVRKEAFLLERLKIEAAIKAQNDSGNAERFRAFLELMKMLKNIYFSLKDDEKREFLDLTISNRTVKGKSVELEPQNWLREAKNACGVLCGDPYRPTSRTGTQLQSQHLEALNKIAGSEEVNKYYALVKQREWKTPNVRHQ